MNQGFLYSALLHFVLLVILGLGLPKFDFEAADPLQPNLIEIIDIADVTTRTTEIEKPDIPDLKPEDDPSASAATDPNPVPESQPVAEEISKKDTSDLKPEPIKKPEVNPQLKVKPRSKPVQPSLEETVKPLSKPILKPKAQSSQPQNNFMAILKNLQDSHPEPDYHDQKPKKDKSSPAPGNMGELSETLTASELDALHQQFASCWNIPAGARDAYNLIVEIKVWVNPDKTVRQAKIMDTGRMSSNPFYRTAAESALRAVLHPKCSPLKLPTHKYEQWKVMVLRFDPKKMLY